MSALGAVHGWHLYELVAAAWQKVRVCCCICMHIEAHNIITLLTSCSVMACRGISIWEAVLCAGSGLDSISPEDWASLHIATRVQQHNEVPVYAACALYLRSHRAKPPRLSWQQDIEGVPQDDADA